MNLAIMAFNTVIARFKLHIFETKKVISNHLTFMIRNAYA